MKNVNLQSKQAYCLCVSDSMCLLQFLVGIRIRWESYPVAAVCLQYSRPTVKVQGYQCPFPSHHYQCHEACNSKTRAWQMLHCRGDFEIYCECSRSLRICAQWMQNSQVLTVNGQQDVKTCGWFQPWYSSGLLSTKLLVTQSALAQKKMTVEMVLTAYHMPQGVAETRGFWAVTQWLAASRWSSFSSTPRCLGWRMYATKWKDWMACSNLACIVFKCGFNVSHDNSDNHSWQASANPHLSICNRPRATEIGLSCTDMSFVCR